jgi:hypothetical protein
MTLHYDEKGKFYTDYVSKDSIQTIIQTTSQRIEGKIYLRVGERISDYLNRGDPFLAVTDAMVYDQQGVFLQAHDFMAVNQALIIWLAPINQESDLDSQADIQP